MTLLDHAIARWTDTWHYIVQVSDVARLLMVAAVLAAATFSLQAWRLTRLDAHDPARVVGELHFAHWAALVLAAVGAVPIGLAVAHESVLAGTLDVTIGVGVIVVAGVVLRREPREALLVAAVGFITHALVDVAHRPGWLAPELMPRWYAVGCAVFDVYIGALCYWSRRR
jgi:hypothetical protein